MKKTKYIFLILPFILAGCKNDTHQYFTVIGTKISSNNSKVDAYEIVSNDLDLDYINLFVKQNDRYEDALDILNKDPYITYNSNTQKSTYYLSKSKYILVNFSYNNVLRNAKYYKGNLNYNDKDFAYDKANFDYFLDSIFESITLINNKVLCCSLFDIFSNEDSKKYVNEINDIIIEKCFDYNIKYIDVSTTTISNGEISALEINNFASSIISGIK